MRGVLGHFTQQMLSKGAALLANPLQLARTLPKPTACLQVLSPTNEQIWQQQHVYSETHFNVGARGPGSYKVW